MVEPGLDLHEWKTRWQELRDAAADAPAETLPEMVRVTAQMLEERGFDIDGSVASAGENSELLRSYLGARDLGRAVEKGEAGPGDVAAAIENLNDIYEYLVADRAA